MWQNTTVTSTCPSCGKKIETPILLLCGTKFRPASEDQKDMAHWVKKEERQGCGDALKGDVLKWDFPAPHNCPACGGHEIVVEDIFNWYKGEEGKGYQELVASLNREK